MSSIRVFARTLRYTPRAISPFRRYAVQPATQRSYTASSIRMSSKVDAIIEDITELYATAKDEFEIAMEETEKGTVYAEEDRKAAWAEMETVEAAYKKVVEGDDKSAAEEVSKRIGHRLRELREGLKRMNELAMEHD